LWCRLPGPSFGGSGDAVDDTAGKIGCKETMAEENTVEHKPFDSSEYADSLIRLQKYLASCGTASRRQAEQIIAAGRVTVNGAAITELGYKVDPANDTVCVDGKQVRPAEHVYYMLNKPRGYMTTKSDPHGRNTVYGLLRDVPYRVFAVGRLDFDTEGLLLFMNDGDLKYRLTHPKYRIERVYRAVVQGHPSAGTLQRLRDGIELEDGMTAPARVRPIHPTATSSEIELTLYEGKKNEVRRMCGAVGHAVIELRRICMAGLRLGELPVGRYRPLTDHEVATLRAATSYEPE